MLDKQFSKIAVLKRVVLKNPSSTEAAVHRCS